MAEYAIEWSSIEWGTLVIEAENRNDAIEKVHAMELLSPDGSNLKVEAYLVEE